MTRKSFLWAASLPCALFFGAPANADQSQKGVYVYGSVGASSIANQKVKDISEHIKYDKDFSYELGLGYDFGKYRIEASWADHDTKGNWSEANCSNCKAGWESILATAYIDFENDSKWTPFVGVSAGTMTSGADTADASSFVYGLQVGTSYQINNNLDLVGKASLLRADDLDYGRTVIVSESHMLSAQLGARYRF